MCLTVFRVPLRRPRPHRAVARLLAAVLIGSLAAVLPAVVTTPAPAGASSRYLCTGYTACQDAGYGHAGYGRHSGTMYWRMYSGHNCTNYVAYRMIRAGMSTERPWSGTGMAYNWGFARDDVRDSTPAVGAVAWWNRGVSGAGSSGHVAYVERVVSPTEIVISEDSWSGDFHWRTIYKDGTSWPTGFLHFVDEKAVEVVTAPRIAAAPRVGVPVRGYQARFEPAADHALQWLRDGTPIAGATGATYTPTPADLGTSLTFRDTGTRAGFEAASGLSTPSPKVVRGDFARPARPSVTGTPMVGQVLTAVPGIWAPSPDSVNYRWSADGVYLANGPTFTLTRAQVGTTVVATAVARRAGYTRGLNPSLGVGPVVQGAVALTRPFAASGTPRHGSTLSLGVGAWTPRDATATYAWLRDGVVVPGAVATTYPLGPADVGHAISARATITKPNFAGATSTTPFGTVTTPSTTTVRAAGRVRAARIRVRVTAPGATPTGTVTVSVGRKSATGRLTDGVAVVRLGELAVGERRVRVTYAGTSVVEASRGVDAVTVLRRSQVRWLNP